MVYQGLSEDKAKEVTVWFQEAVGVQDWEFELAIQDKPPKWAEGVSKNVVGMNMSDRRYKSSLIWVSPKRCNDLDDNTFDVLFHELMHTVACDVGIDNDETDRMEFLWDKLAEVLGKLYKYEHNEDKSGV